MMYIVLLALILGLDIATKYVVQQNMLLYQSVPIIPGFLNFTYIQNPGAAFGFMANMPHPWRSIFFVTISIVALVVIIVLFVKSPADDYWNRTALILILSGAVGNLIDRLRFGAVVDFIDVYIRSWHWPAFNVADSAISIGVGMLIIELLIQKDSAAD